MKEPHNHAALIPLYSLLAALAIVLGLLISIIIALMRQTKQREKLHNNSYPQARSKSKIISIKTNKN